MKLEKVIALAKEAKQKNKPKKSKMEIEVKQVPSKKKKSSRKSRRPKATLSDGFVDAILYPDLIGPVRFPILGSDARVTLGMARGRMTMVGDSTSIVQFANLSNIVYGTNVGATRNTNSANNSLISPTGIPAAVAFPTVGSVADARLTSGGIVVQYTGNVLNCSGEIILGTLPDAAISSGTFSYNSLSYLPGIIRVPIAQLINNPLRVTLRHAAPQSWDLVIPNSGVADIDVPFIATLGLPNTQTLSVDFVQNFEVRSNVTASFQIPYAASSSGRASDDAAMTNAQDYISNLSNTVTSMIPDKPNGLLGRVVDGLFEGASQMAFQSARAAGGLLVDSALQASQNSLRLGNHNRYVHSLMGI